MKKKENVVNFIETETPGSLYQLQKNGFKMLWEDNTLGFINHVSNKITYIQVGDLVLYLGSTSNPYQAIFLLPNGTIGNVNTYLLGRISFYGLKLAKVNGDNNA